MARKDQIGLALMINSGLTDTQVTNLNSRISTLMTALGRTGITKRVVFTGDSQSAYWNNKVVRRMDWVVNAQRMQSGSISNIAHEFYPVGVSGQTLATINTNYASAGKEASYYKAARSQNIIFVWAATNDISVGATLGDLQTRFQAFCTAAHGTGYLVVAMPTMARNFSSDSTKTLLISSYNVWLAANWATYADAYTGFPAGGNYFQPRSDFASDAAYITANNNIAANATYYVDGTHLTEATGYKEWGDLCATTLLTL
jgi:hypothetical protein